MRNFLNNAAAIMAPDAYSQGMDLRDRIDQRRQTRSLNDARQSASNMLAQGGNMYQASNALLQGGDLQGGLVMRDMYSAQKDQARGTMDAKRQQEAQGTLAYLSQMKDQMRQQGGAFDPYAFIAADPQAFQRQTGTSFEEFYKSTGGRPLTPQMIDQMMAQAQAAAGMAPAAPPQRQVIKGADGFQYYQDDGSRVLPHVQAPGPAPITPYQQAQIDLDRQRLEMERARNAAGQGGQAGFRTLSPDEVAANNLPPGTLAQQGPDGRIHVTREGTDLNAGGQAQGVLPYNSGPRASEFWQVVEPGALPGPGFGGGQFYNAQAVDGLGPLDDALPDDQGRPRASGEYQTYVDRGMGKNDADRLNTIQEAAQVVANTGNVRLDGLESLLDQGAPVGPMAATRVGADRFAGMVGLSTMPDEDRALLSQFRGLSQDYALEVGQAMKGSFSNADREFVQEKLNANMTPEEARGVINMVRAVNDRIQLHADAASDWANRYGGLSRTDSSGRDFDTAWREYQRTNPVFKREQISGTVGEGSGAPSGARTGIDDETGRPVYEDPQTKQIFFSDTGELVE